MREIKYIIDNRNCPIIFESCFIHSDISKDKNIISAGFIRFFNGKFHCYGESTSLGVHSRPEIDSKIINKLFDVDF